MCSAILCIMLVDRQKRIEITAGGRSNDGRNSSSEVVVGNSDGKYDVRNEMERLGMIGEMGERMVQILRVAMGQAENLSRTVLTSRVFLGETVAMSLATRLQT